jgi:hypothetical protein
MRRLLLCLGLAVAVFGAVFAFAASLTVSPSSLGAGSGSVTSCDAAVGTTYSSPSFTTGTGYTVNSVTVTGLDTAACAGQTVYVTLADSANGSPVSGSAAVPGAGTTVNVSLSGPVAASLVANAHVAIS